LVHVAADAAAHEQERARLIKALGAEQPAYRLSRNAYFRSAPVCGEVALVFPGAAAAYPGMGRELMLALPELTEEVLSRFPALAYAQGWLDPANEAIMHDPAQVLLGSSFLCQVHALLSLQWLNIKPQAVLGVSSGETNSVLAMGAWRSTDLGPMLKEIIDSGMYSREITGEFAVARRAWGVDGPVNWRNFWVLAPVEEVKAALEGEERVYLSMINSDNDCVIAGDGAGCERVAQRLGGKRIFPLGHDIIAHCPLMENWREPWYRIHHRETLPVPGVRFYSNASGRWYEAERERIAEALTNQATNPVDFRRVVNAAYDDGVRIFIENGPRGSCANWIDHILGERDHVAVCLDRPRAGLMQLVDALAQLEVCGVPVARDALLERLASEYPEAKPVKELVFPAHFKPVVFPPLEAVQPQGASAQQAAPAKAASQASMPAPAVRVAPAPAQTVRPNTTAAAPAASHQEAIPAMETMTAAPHVALPQENAAAPQSASPAQPASTPPVTPGMAEAPEQPQVGGSQPEMLPAAGMVSGTPAWRRQIIDQIGHFHAQVSDTHRQFLTQQSRAMDMLAGLGAQAMVNQGVLPPVMQRVAPAAPQVHVPPASMPQAPVAAPAPKPAVSPVVAPQPTSRPQQAAVMPASPKASATPTPQAVATQPALKPAPTSGAAAPQATATITMGAMASKPGNGAAGMPHAPVAADKPAAARPHASQPEPTRATAVAKTPAKPKVPEPEWFKKISAMPLSSEERLGLQAFRAIFNYTYRDAVPENLPGPKWGRKELEILASDKISRIMGPQFEPIDQYSPIVRMPMPPLLLADSVLGIDAEPLSMSSKGKLWTESVVEEDNWYLHHGHVPPGIALEMGQADLLLISWLGVDLENKGEKVYRLLGIDAIPFRGPLKIGERMIVDINCGGYATLGGIRLFFFNSYGWVNGKMISAVRNGQAGFFTEEILKGSGGILWDPVKDGSPRLNGPLDPPAGGGLLDHGKRSFTAEEVFAFSEDRVVDCFGPLYAETLNHTRTPRLQRGLMLLIDEVVECDPRGGPWGRGYIKAIKRLTDEEWFYDGHFKGDPCMPGTLTMEAIAQLAIFACAAMGYTVGRDGWRFEPLVEEISHIRARGQTVPGAREVIYELFVEDVSTSDVPTFHAQGMSTVDGLRSFHGSGCGGRLVPAYPMESRVRLLPKATDARAARADGLLLDRAHLLHLAWGKPSDAFGETYKVFDWTRPCPRLPGPPLLLLSRIEQAPEKLWTLAAGASAQLSWDVSEARWLGEEQRAAGVPLWALAEHGLQASSWLLSALGAALDEQDARRFDIQELRLSLPKALEETPQSLSTGVRLAAVGADGTMLLECALATGTQAVAQIAVTMAVRTGLRPTTPEAPMAPAGEVVDLALEHAALPHGLLALVDQAHGFWPQGGEAGLGLGRVSLAMNHGLWFFTCHTFGAPRWPCGFYLEMATQASTLLAHALGHEAQGWHASGETITLRVHDEIYPGSGELLCDVSVLEVQDGPALRLAVRFHQAGRLVAELQGLVLQPGAGPAAAGILDAASEPLLADYVANWGPVVPPMWLVDRLAQAALERLPGRVIVAMPESGWNAGLWQGRDGLAYSITARLIGPNRMRCEMTSLDEPAVALAWASFQVAEECSLGPRAALVLDGGTTFAHPYAQGVLGQGAAWQAMTSLTLGADGASALLSPTGFSPAALYPALLDAALQSVIPDQEWWAALPRDKTMVPIALEGAAFFRPAIRITEEVRLESRLASQSGDQVRTWHQLMHQGRTWAQFTVVWRLEEPMPWHRLPRQERARWWHRQGYQPEALLSRVDGKGSTVVEHKDIEPFDDQQLRAFYGLEPQESILAGVALREHVARLAMGHPFWVSLAQEADTSFVARSANSPGRRFTLQLKSNARGVRVSEAGPVELDTALGFAALDMRWPLGEWLGRDLMLAVLQRFAGGLFLENPSVLNLMSSSPVLYVANHQIDLEGIVFAIALTAMSGRRCRVMARDTVRQEFWGQVFSCLGEHPGVSDPDLFLLVERQDINAMWQAFQDALRTLRDDNGALLIHVEGVHKERAREPVGKVSAALVDSAVALELPLVPVRFAGSLPLEPVTERPEWPVGLAPGRAWVGGAIMPQTLRPLGSKQRAALVAEAINRLGAPADALENEVPTQGDPALHEAVAQRMRQAQVSRAQAILYCLLAEVPDPSAETRDVLALCDGARSPDEVPGWLVHFAREPLGARL
jgi:3-hydroxymyristoyl/3-hydroxydecanoyl-(acyl carrier protein) dehydratase/malonyl CoA-acyl carrier protein transacylase